MDYSPRLKRARASAMVILAVMLLGDVGKPARRRLGVGRWWLTSAR
jgi:hypothetical protein